MKDKAFITDTHAPVYELTEISFSYGRNAKRTLDGLELTLMRGGLTFLLGENGSGKSTLLKLMLNELKPHTGNVRLFGKPVSAYSVRERAKLIAYVPQGYFMPFNYSALEVVAMGRCASLSVFASLSRHDYAQAFAAMERLSIPHLAKRGFLELSGGERKLCLIARALAQACPIILMDEPTSELDYGNRLKILSCIKRITDVGATVLMSSHDPASAFAFADTVVAIDQGRIAAEGKPEAVLTEDFIEKLYGVKTRLYRTENDGTLIAPYRV